MRWLHILVFAALLLPATVQASDRLFTYTYETPVIQAGQVELEPWLTATVGKDHYYFRLDHRMELEWGIARGVQTALYLNFRVQAEDVAGAMVKETKFRGFSSEWKFSVLDPVADPLGLGLYLEFGVQPHEVEFEAKVLVDKVIGPLVLAFNAVGEAEVKPQAGGAAPEVEGKLIFLLGAGVMIGQHFAIGAEVREMNVFEHGELEHAWLHAGPAVHVRGERVWGTLTVLPQLLDLKSRKHDLESGAALEARLLVGVHF
jgi:hypothetical protein